VRRISTDGAPKGNSSERLLPDSEDIMLELLPRRVALPDMTLIRVARFTLAAKKER
jgi:hypothetical protein